MLNVHCCINHIYGLVISRTSLLNYLGINFGHNKAHLGKTKQACNKLDVINLFYGTGALLYTVFYMCDPVMWEIVQVYQKYQFCRVQSVKLICIVIDFHLYS